MKIDLLAFAPHPDDAELYCAGILLAAKAAGKTTAIADLTQGELSTRGNPALRRQETEEASRILNLDARINLGIPDGDIADTPENRWKVIETIRTYAPGTVLLPYPHDRHPDHEHGSRLVKDALFYSGVGKVQGGGTHLEPYRPRRAYYYMLTNDFAPDLLVDISGYMEQKRAAIAAYRSQFHTPGATDDEPQTYISSQGFMESLEARSRRYGFLAGGDYAEGLKLISPLSIAGEKLMGI